MDSEKLWDKMATRYAARPIKNMAAYDHTIERTLAYLTPQDRVLEVGTGPGTTPLRLAPHVAQITATDLSGNLIDIARQRATDAGIANVTFEHAALMASGANDESYDAVAAFNLLHLIEDLDGAVAHLVRQLKPGGYFISKSGCLGEGSFVLPLVIRALQLIGKAPYVASLKVAELEAAITAQGFDIVESEDHSRNNTARFVVARKR